MTIEFAAPTNIPLDCTLTLTAEEAEEVLRGLAWRAKQNGIRGSEHADRIVAVGQRLQQVFRAAFGWTGTPFDAALASPVTVTVRGAR